MTTAAVLLAAGGGSRFRASGGRTHKLLAPYLGRTVVEWSIEAAAAAHLDAMYVVRGATDVPLPPLGGDGVQFVRNDRWGEGLATSLQAGVARARRDGHAAVVVGLGDQPLVQALIVYTTAAYVFVNFFVDILYGLIDPRIQMRRAGP